MFIFKFHKMRICNSQVTRCTDLTRIESLAIAQGNWLARDIILQNFRFLDVINEGNWKIEKYCNLFPLYPFARYNRLA